MLCRFLPNYCAARRHLSEVCCFPYLVSSLTLRLLMSYTYIYIYIYIYDISSLRVNDLTFILLTWRKWLAPNNASRQQMGFNSGFKGLRKSKAVNGKLWNITIISAEELNSYSDICLTLKKRICKSWTISWKSWRVTTYVKYTNLFSARTVSRMNSSFDVWII